MCKLTGDISVLAVDQDPVEPTARHRARQVRARQHLPCAEAEAGARVEGGAQLVRFVHYCGHACRRAVVVVTERERAQQSGKEEELNRVKV